MVELRWEKLLAHASRESKAFSADMAFLDNVSPSRICSSPVRRGGITVVVIAIIAQELTKTWERNKWIWGVGNWKSYKYHQRSPTARIIKMFHRILRSFRVGASKDYSRSTYVLYVYVSSTVAKSGKHTKVHTTRAVGRNSLKFQICWWFNNLEVLERSCLQ